MKMRKKVNLDCGTCPLGKYCPIPVKPGPFPVEMVRRMLCPKMKDGRRIRCALCFYLQCVKASKENVYHVCKFKGACVDTTITSRPPKWCPILVAKRKGL